jgi:hypothetical protein
MKGNVMLKHERIKFLLEVMQNPRYNSEVKKHAKGALEDFGVDVDEQDRYATISKEVDEKLGIYETENSSLFVKKMLLFMMVALLIGMGMLFGLVSITSQSDTDKPQTIESTTKSSGEGRTL